MIEGTVSYNREASVELFVAATTNPNLLFASKTLASTFVVDTGFTGYLTLSVNTIAALNLKYMESRPVMLADGSETDVRVFRAFVLWHNAQWRSVNVFSMDGDPLIGMSLLHGSRLVMDVVDGGKLSISPLP